MWILLHILDTFVISRDGRGQGRSVRLGWWLMDNLGLDPGILDPLQVLFRERHKGIVVLHDGCSGCDATSLA